MKNKKGILLIALGHENYFKMAINLAASVKYNEPEMLIAIVNDGSPIVDTNIFDISIVAPAESYMNNDTPEFIKAKTWIYDLSPFEATIFLDVDMIILEGRKLMPLFDELKEWPWMIANTGQAKVSIWADIEEVKKNYKTEAPFYNYHSEFIYFKKNAAVKKYFDTVKKIFGSPKVKGTNFGGASISDELAFQIASMLTGFYPGKENFLPTYWFGRDPQAQYKYPYQLAPTFISYSIGGNSVPKKIKAHYNNLASYYCSMMGLQSPYRVTDKKTFLPERSKI